MRSGLEQEQSVGGEHAVDGLVVRLPHQGAGLEQLDGVHDGNDGGSGSAVGERPVVVAAPVAQARAVAVHGQRRGEDQVRALIDAAGPDKKVYLVTTRVPQAYQDMNNQLFWDVAATYDNVQVIDWYNESAGHDEYFWGDGTHLRPEGAEAYVMMLRRAITGR